MSRSLKMVTQELTRFQKGEIGLAAMWDQIENNLSGTLNNEEPDPYEDDKAERCIRPNPQKLKSQPSGDSEIS